MKHFSSIISLISIVVIAIIAYGSYVSFNRYLEYKAVNDCANAYRTEYSDISKADKEAGKDYKIIRPLEGAFKECVWNKGIHKFYGTK